VHGPEDVIKLLMWGRCEMPVLCFIVHGIGHIRQWNKRFWMDENTTYESVEQMQGSHEPTPLPRSKLSNAPIMRVKGLQHVLQGSR